MGKLQKILGHGRVWKRLIIFREKIFDRIIEL
jgi:hypothetical protein